MKLIGTLKVNGKGLWTNVEASVDVKSIDVEYDDEGNYGEARVYFDTATWDVNKNGLIYTDPSFIKELRALLMGAGFTRAGVKDISYSEQGMQGDDYVSFDVGKDFSKDYAKVNNQASAKK